MSTFKIKKIIDKPSLFGINGCNLILYMLIKITFRKGAVVGLVLKLCLLAAEEKDDQEGTPGRSAGESL